MARTDWVVSRLKNWERWCCQMNGGGLGFASQTAFLNELSGQERECKIPIDEVEASITNDAVESLREGRPHVYAVLQGVYPRGWGATETARRMGVNRSNVYALLDVADRLLAAWFNERTERQARQRAATEKSFTP